MQLKFPLDDVQVEITTEKKQVISPLYDDRFYRLNQDEFSMDVKEVGCFYAAHGDYINLVLYPEATRASVELYLNGSAYGAILHQRQLMPLHGSSFVFKDLGIMLCGESGAGKSSLTASFIKNGSQFLTDDVSPIEFKNAKPYILPLSDRIKLWQDSLEQLKYEKDGLTEIWSDYNKYYLPVESQNTQAYTLDFIFIIEKHEGSEVKIEELTGVDKFQHLRNEIYRWEYLQGMKKTEANYLKKLLDINIHVRTFKVVRPETIEIGRMRTILEDHIETQIDWIQTWWNLWWNF